MMTIAFTILFASAGLFACGAIAVSVLSYGPEVQRIRNALRACVAEREVRLVITEYRPAARQAADVLRPDFSDWIRDPVAQAQTQLRAAA